MARPPLPLIVQWRDLALLFHLTTYRSVAKWDTAGPPLGAKVAGGLSLALWAGIVAFGRLTAYDWWTFE